jgi:hypothetical protein
MYELFDSHEGKILVIFLIIIIVAQVGTTIRFRNPEDQKICLL